MKEKLGEEEYRRRVQAALSDPEIDGDSRARRCAARSRQRAQRLDRRAAAVSAVFGILAGMARRDSRRAKDSRLSRQLLGRVRHSSRRRYALVGRMARTEEIHRRAADLSRPAGLSVSLRISALVRSLAQGQRHRDSWMSRRVHVFLDGGEGEWIEANQWPLPQTRWTPFYLHEHGLLSEHEFWAERSVDCLHRFTVRARQRSCFARPRWSKRPTSAVRWR